ncbi:MAG: MBL fold metallo-hydrolase [Rubrivivax sp.]|nr:MBL fold metallo-hydrolase [Rubrivivax sp.]
MITNPQSGTNVHEIADGIYRINTPVHLPDGQAFNFNQYLIVDDEPVLFHTGPRAMHPLVRQAIAAVMPLERLRYLGLSHVEADECGALDLLMADAPQAVPLCSRVAAMVSIGDLSPRPPRALADGEQLVIGRRTLVWHDTPHVPHGWDCGLMSELTTGTFFCGDLYTQGGPGTEPIVESDIVGPSEAFRASMDYYAHAPHTAATLERLAQTRPRTLACMHGSAWRGDGAALLRHLAVALGARR